MTDASRANPSSHIVISDIGALRTNRRVADRPSFPVLGSSSHASGSKSDISTNSKSRIRLTRRAGSVVSGSNDGCDDVGGKCCGIFLVEVPSLVFIATTTDLRFSYRSVTHEYN